MSNQGWMVQAAAFSYPGFIGSSDYGAISRSSPVDTSSESTGSDKGENRLELLRRIKKRVKSGFYNSDAVIDDIGHGFAQALDQAL
jgi:hypothetical protein